MAKQIKWTSLLRLSELDFVPDAPRILNLADEVIQTISWLTAATGEDRRLLRCTKDGALLVAHPWSLFTSVESDEMYPESGTPATFTPSVEHKGLLLAIGEQVVLARITRVSGGDYEDIYVAPYTMFWYPFSIYSVRLSTVPDPLGSASYNGAVVFN